MLLGMMAIVMILKTYAKLYVGTIAMHAIVVMERRNLPLCINITSQNLLLSRNV
jgi:hypothetical protein